MGWKTIWPDFGKWYAFLNVRCCIHCEGRHYPIPDCHTWRSCLCWIQHCHHNLHTCCADSVVDVVWCIPQLEIEALLMPNSYFTISSILWHTAAIIKGVVPWFDCLIFVKHVFIVFSLVIYNPILAIGLNCWHERHNDGRCLRWWYSYLTGIHIFFC